MHVLLTEEAFTELAGLVSPLDGTAYVIRQGEARLIEGVGEVKDVRIIKMTTERIIDVDQDRELSMRSALEALGIATFDEAGVPPEFEDPEDDASLCFDGCCT